MTIDVAAGARTGTFIRSLGYICLEVLDLAAWESFATDVLGLGVLPGPSADTRLLKMDSQPYRFFLAQGPADDLVGAGWQVADGDTLDAYARYLAESGIAFDWAEAPLIARRGVERMLRVRDPNGVWHEAYTGLPASDPFVPHLTRSTFVTGPGGLGHIVFGARDYAGSVAFARRVLGAGVSDIIEQQITPTVSAHVTFMHVNERHHSIAFAGRAGGKRLHHFMIEVENIADVGLARDRHLKTGLTIAQDIGQHPNDRMISYYGATPSGFFVEYGWGGVKVDVETWRTGAYDRMSDWGHRPLPPAMPMQTGPDPRIMQGAISPLGDWSLSITTPMGEQKSALTIAEGVTGKIVSMGVPVDIYDGAVAGNRLSFKADVSQPFAMTLAFSLAMDGDKLAGQVQAGSMGHSPVTGVCA